STIEAVNRGEIFRYLTKPWNDGLLLRVLNDGLERKRLRAERDRLQALTQQQNLELEALNRDLEEKVRERTAALESALSRVDEAHTALKNGFTNTVRAFSSVIDARTQAHGAGGRFGRRVAAQIRAIGSSAGLDEGTLQDTIFAALLYDIGKLALPDELAATPIAKLNANERHLVLRHPAQGAGLLMTIEPLRGAAAILRAVNEWYDGSGVPDGVAGESIPLGARLLAVVGDYELLTSGGIDRRHWSTEEACVFLERSRGRRYDPRALDLVLGMYRLPPKPERRVRTVRPSELAPGMVLARDLVSPLGLLMLSADYVIDEALIRQIRSFADFQDAPLELIVYAPPC
ncbi:MAG TPA: HD domain-containing phosphohydrolase, partial [Burkholderiaceae bacterium]|nr:HD domain-containing phosphohydrolase [Burkholderiaceae bacterium]